jgi:hypothetical protein
MAESSRRRHRTTRPVDPRRVMGLHSVALADHCRDMWRLAEGVRYWCAYGRGSSVSPLAPSLSCAASSEAGCDPASGLSGPAA